MDFRTRNTGMGYSRNLNRMRSPDRPVGWREKSYSSPAEDQVGLSTLPLSIVHREAKRDNPAVPAL